MSFVRRHMTFANLISMLALFIALGGTSYAAVQLKKNAVASKHIKKNAVTSSKIKANAVTSSKVKNGSLRLADFGSGQIPTGPTGPAGAPGTARAFARVAADGTLEPGTSNGVPQFKGVDQVDIQKAAVGVYCFGGLGFDVASAMVSIDNAQAASTSTEVASVAIQRGNNLGTCDADHQQTRVVITDVSPALANAALADARFTIWFE